MFHIRALTVVAVLGISVSSANALPQHAGFPSAITTTLSTVFLEGEACGGPLTNVCAANEFCLLPTGACNNPSVTGICTVNVGGCAAVFDPVCGCDGTTYPNSCEALIASVNIDHNGECVIVNAAIPTTSSWGVICMALIMLTMGTLLLRQRNLRHAG